MFVDAPRARLPHDVPQGRRDRSGLLSPARSQRSGRAGGNAARHVPEDSPAADHAPALRREARRLEGVLAPAEADAMVEQYRRELDEGKSHGQAFARHDRQQAHRRLEQVSERRLVRAGHDGRAHRAAARARREADVVSVELHSASSGRERRAGPREDDRRPATARLGLRRDARVRIAADGRLRSSHHAARTAVAARSSIVMRCGTTRIAARPTFRSKILRRASRASPSSIRCCRKRP